ncbi:MAG: AAA family ATPase [Phycisphaerales bacterium]|nr:AAA family ATPase [Phycisphaerales bacterium]
MTLDSIIAALRDPDAYPHRPEAPIEILRTHISVIVLAGNRVYKIKRPVRLDFLDYSTLERRRHFCAEEVRLNRRLAGNVYRGVVAITREDDAAIRIGGRGTPVEYAVEMERLPADHMLDALLDRDALPRSRLDELSHLLVDFHRTCATGAGVDEYGTPDELRRQSAEGFDELDPFVGVTITPAARDHLRAAATRWLDAHEPLLARRVREGRIREGHGDLHAGNLCILDDRIIAYDCIEFSPRFRCRDVACEIAFLAMDLDSRGRREEAAHVVAEYAACASDPDLPTLLDFYKPHLALVRGKVASIRAADAALDDDARRRAVAEAQRYMHLAAGYTLPPALILMCGLPGTGKSHVARALATPLGANVLRSDVIRKTLAPDATIDRARDAAALDRGLYAPDVTDRTYDAMQRQAMAHLVDGTPVILDATFPARARRTSFLDGAAAAGVASIVVEVTCADMEIRRRLRSRAAEGRDASDADERVYEHARSTFEPPDEVPPAQRVTVSSETPLEDQVAAVIERLVGAAHGQR